MPRLRLIWKVAPAYVLVVVVCTTLAAWSAGESVRDYDYQRTADQLRTEAGILRQQVTNQLARNERDQIRNTCEQLANVTTTRITVIDAQGVVIGDTHKSPAQMENHADRQEFKLAMASGSGKTTRYSQTLGTDMMYVAVALGDENSPTGVVRASVAMLEVREALGEVYWRIAIGGALTAIVAGILITWVFVRQISRPLRAVQVGANRFAEGKLDVQLPVPDSDEIGTLAQVLNTMASRLDETIRTITRQSREREAILSSMVEGVIAVDIDQRIITLNRTASRMLNVSIETPRGMSLSEVIRNTELRLFIDKVLTHEREATDELNLNVDGSRRELQVEGAVMQDQSETIGAVVVLHDVTQLRQLESIRREFVANVSHELKTPIAAIKAAAETLLDLEQEAKDAQDASQEQGGGPSELSDETSGESQPAPPPFLSMIGRQSERLNAIVDDLLALARIEQDEAGQLVVNPCELRRVLVAASETCSAKAAAKEMHVVIQGDPSETVTAPVNDTLLEQAVVNLLDNAVKYGRQGTQVTVSLTTDGEQATIAVTDQGQGIEAVHLPRLFERFYRTDKARSRAVGGTGLGLAIVKHVAQAHGGRVSVNSTVGQGSTFRIHLPLGEAEGDGDSGADAPVDLDPKAT